MELIGRRIGKITNIECNDKDGVYGCDDEIKKKRMITREGRKKKNNNK